MSPYNICNLIKCEGQKLSVNVVIHGCGPIIKSKEKDFFNMLVVDQSGVIVVRIFSNLARKFSFSLSDIQAKNAVYTMELYAKTYVRKESDTSATNTKDEGEKVAYFTRNTSPKLCANDSNERHPLLEWYKSSYEILGATTTRLFDISTKSGVKDGVRISLKGRVILKVDDDDKLKTTYTIKCDKDNHVNVIMWKTSGDQEFADNDIVIMRHVKTDFWKNSIQFTYDEFSESLILQKSYSDMVASDGKKEAVGTPSFIENSQTVQTNHDCSVSPMSMSQNLNWTQNWSPVLFSDLSSPSKRKCTNTENIAGVSFGDRVVPQMLAEIQNNSNPQKLMTSLLDEFRSKKSARTKLNMNIMNNYIEQCVNEYPESNKTYVLQQFYKVLLLMPQHSPSGLCSMFSEVWSQQDEIIKLNSKTELLHMCIAANAPAPQPGDDQQMETENEDDFLKDL